MSRPIVGLLTLELELPGIASLKDKRSVLQGIIRRLRTQYNCACAETDLMDEWESAVLAVTVVSNDGRHCNSMLSQISHWVETNAHDVSVMSESIEIF
jgi:hypothetical protein